MSVVSPSIETVEAPAAAPQASLLSALRVRDFRLVWIGETVSVLGDQFYFVALPWLTLQLTGSGLALGAVAAVGGIPRALFMLLGGAITDRFSPRRVMFISNALRIVLTALLMLLVLTNQVQVWMLFVMSFAFGLVDAFFFPAQSAIVPQVVEPHQIESGNALMQITQQLSGFVGPALAGLVIATLSGVSSIQALEQSGASPGTAGIGAAIGFDALTFVVAAIALWLMKGGTARSQSAQEQSILGSIMEGLRAVWSDPLLRIMILLTAAINFLFAGPFSIGMPVLADRMFAEGAAALGMIVSAFGGGALVGALLAGTLPAPKQLGVVVMLLIAGFGLGTALLGSIQTLPLEIAVCAVIGLTIGYVNVVTVSWLQKRIPTESMGRVMSLMTLGSVGLLPISSLLAGVLVDVSLPLLFGGAGTILVILSLFSLTTREIRSMRPM